MYVLYRLTQELLKMMKSALENQVAQISSIPEHLDFLSESKMEETKRYDNYDRVMDITLEMLKTVIECTLYENATLTKFADLIGNLKQLNKQSPVSKEVTIQTVTPSRLSTTDCRFPNSAPSKKCLRMSQECSSEESLSSECSCANCYSLLRKLSGRRST